MVWYFKNELLVSKMKPQIFLVPRWSGTPRSDWYDWFEQEINTRYGTNIVALDMPQWNAPDVEKATEFLTSQLPMLSESTFLIGHSVGCLAVLNFLDKTFMDNPALKIGGIMMVAGWFEVDEAWDTALPWLNNEHLSYPLLQKNIDQKLVIISDNDRFTSDYELNSELWKTRLGAEVRLCSGRAHFNGKIEPDVLLGFVEMLDNFLVKDGGRP